VQAKWQPRQTTVFVALELLMRQKLEVRLKVLAILHFAVVRNLSINERHAVLVFVVFVFWFLWYSLPFSYLKNNS